MNTQISSYEALLEQIRTDEDFKQRFITEPKTVLAEIGAKVPDSVKVEVHEDGPSLRNYILLTKEQLEKLNQETEESIISKVLQKALADDNFKSLLLQNPNAAIKEATGEEVPDTLEIRFYEDTPTVKHLVIPAHPDKQELNESELDMVAGGIFRGVGFPPFSPFPPIIAGMFGGGGMFGGR